MGFWQNLKELSDFNKKRKARKEQRAAMVNNNPTEEQLKNNKKGKLSYLWSVISIFAYVLGFLAVALAFQNNIAVGIFALIIVILVTSQFQRKAISLAQEQRKINGKGLFALIFACILYH